jgi:hypothetical protein
MSFLNVISQKKPLTAAVALTARTEAGAAKLSDPYCVIALGDALMRKYYC